MKDALKVVLPNGSLWERLVMYLALAGYQISKPDRTGSCGTVNGVEFIQVDRRMVLRFMARRYDAGITGYDLILNSGFGLTFRFIAELCFSRSTDQPSRWVLAKSKRPGLIDSAQKKPLVACELPALARILLEQTSVFPDGYDILEIDGSEELCVRDGLADYVLVVTETGGSIRACDLEIVEGCGSLLVSTPRIVARQRLSDEKEELLQALSFSLQAVVGAQQFVMVAFDIPVTVSIESLALPSSVAPSVVPTTNPEWNAGEVCIPRVQFGAVLVRLKAVGARGIVMRNAEGYLA